MLSAKPWKAEAVVRLGAGLFICIVVGSLVAEMVGYLSAPIGKRLSPAIFYPLAIAGLLFLGAALVLLFRPWQLETFRRRIAGLFICFYAGVFLGIWLQKFAAGSELTGWHVLVATLSFQGAGLALVGRFIAEHGLTWREAFGLSNRARRAILLGILAACLFLPIAVGLQQVSRLVLTHIPKLQIQPEEQQAVQALRNAIAWWDRLALGLVTVLLAPVAEEVLFRGVLYAWIRKEGYPRAALWGSSLLFAGFHLNLVTFLPLLVLALGLAFLYERCDNLLAPIAAHSFFNLANFALLYWAEAHGG